MKTPQQKIIEFMVAKQQWLNNITQLRLEYINQEDVNEIRSWTNDQAEKTIQGILGSPMCVFNCSSCPFCYRYNDDCFSCTYGKRHGKCKITHYKNPWTQAIRSGKITDSAPIPNNIIDILRG